MFMLEILNENSQLQTRWAAVMSAARTVELSSQVRDLPSTEFPRVLHDHEAALQSQRLLGGDPYGETLH